MGAPSGTVQNTAMQEPTQGKGGGTPAGYGSPASTGIGKGIGLASDVVSQAIEKNQQNGSAMQPVDEGQGQNMQLARNKITYPSISGQQQFGQPMQSASNAYPNTIGESQQSNQINASGKGKGA